MAIPNKVQPMRSGIAGILAKEGPNRIKKFVLDYTFSSATENHATPSRAVSFVDAGKGTVKPGGESFAGLILGNERVLSDVGDSWHATGDQIEVLQMGEMFVNIDNVTNTDYATMAIGDPVFYDKVTGKLCAGVTSGQTNTNVLQIPTAIVTGISPYVAAEGARLASIAITGPFALEVS